MSKGVCSFYHKQHFSIGAGGGQKQDKRKTNPFHSFNHKELWLFYKVPSIGEETRFRGETWFLFTHNKYIKQVLGSIRNGDDP